MTLLTCLKERETLYEFINLKNSNPFITKKVHTSVEKDIFT